MKFLDDKSFKKEVIQSRIPVIVFFAVEWNGACHIMSPVMEQLINDFGDEIKFCKVDIDSDKVISKKYGIMDLPTLLFFKNGCVEDHIIGAVSKKVLSKRISVFLRSQI